MSWYVNFVIDSPWGKKCQQIRRQKLRHFLALVILFQNHTINLCMAKKLRQKGTDETTIEDYKQAENTTTTFFCRTSRRIWGMLSKFVSESFS